MAPRTLQRTCVPLRRLAPAVVVIRHADGATMEPEQVLGLVRWVELPARSPRRVTAWVGSTGCRRTHVALMTERVGISRHVRVSLTDQLSFTLINVFKLCKGQTVGNRLRLLFNAINVSGKPTVFF